LQPAAEPTGSRSPSLAHEVADELDGRLRVLLHDPVPGIRNDSGADVAANKAQLDRHTLAKGFFGAQGQDWHFQLASLREERLVVLGILTECGELLERVVHRMGSCVQSRVMLARLLIDLLRIRGELVPEAIQVDPLATLHEPLDIGTAEVEVPEKWTAHNRVPVADTG